MAPRPPLPRAPALRLPPRAVARAEPWTGSPTRQGKADSAPCFHVIRPCSRVPHSSNDGGKALGDGARGGGLEGTRGWGAGGRRRLQPLGEGLGAGRTPSPPARCAVRVPPGSRSPGAAADPGPQPAGPEVRIAPSPALPAAPLRPRAGLSPAPAAGRRGRRGSCSEVRARAGSGLKTQGQMAESSWRNSRCDRHLRQ